MAYRRILVPIDGSPTSNKALVAALNLARECGGKVRVLHTIDELAMASDLGNSAVLINALREFAGKVLADAIAVASSAGVEADTRLVEAPGKRLGETVAQEAAVWDADLVVVGTHGRRGVSRLLLGSGAESVIRLSDLPVLVVRGDDAGR